MQNLCLVLSRLLLAGWIGGAVLFVVTSVAEQLSPDLDVTTKRTLALIRFPWYYTFGFSMVTFGLLFGLLGMAKNVVRAARRVTFIMVTSFAILVMAGDFIFVYLPLARMSREQVAAGGVVDAEATARFTRYHEYSKRVNLLGLGLVSVAAFLVCGPTWEPEEDEPDRRWRQ